MRSKYLKKFPQPLLDDLVCGRWLPIVGAGMSRNAVLGSGKTMPLWNELGEKLAVEIPNFEYESPIDAISAFDHEFGRPKLIEKLYELLHISKATPGAAHRAFCDVPFDIVCTTNFDFLLERQYELMPRPCTPLVEEGQLSINLQGSSIALLKLHGDLNHPSRLVATEEDYDAFLERFPVLATYLANLLITRTPVLIGYSMGDPDFRQLWQIVEERLGKARRPAYALSVGASPTETARFDRRGVKVVNLSQNRKRPGQVVSETFEELKNYWREKNPIVSQFEGEFPEQSTRQRESATKSCFFAIPDSARPFYQAHVFPLVYEVELAILTPEPATPLGGSFFATIDALVSQASLIIVDTSSEYAVAEARRAIAREKSTKVLVIAQEGTSTPFDMIDMDILYRPDFSSGDIGKFLDELLVRLTAIRVEIEPKLADEMHAPLRSEEIEPKMADEMHRLLKSNEFRAAVVSAITHLA